MSLTTEWRGAFVDHELNALHAEAFGHAVLAKDWWGPGQSSQPGLGVPAPRGPTDRLVNVAWDGGVHAFLLDTMVTKHERRQGHAARMVQFAAEKAKLAGCEWRMSISSRISSGSMSRLAVFVPPLRA